MRKALFIAGLLLATAVSCSRQEPAGNDASKPSRFFGVMEEDASTRMYADSQLRTLWNEGDLISIFEKRTYNDQYIFTGEDGDSAGPLEYVSGSHMGVAADIADYMAVYPYASTTKCNQDEVLTLVLPEVQTYRPNMYGLGANTMVARAQEDAHGDIRFYFKNLCGYRNVKLYGEGITVASVTLTAKSDVALAGKVKVTVPEVNGTPEMGEIEGDVTSITLVCPEPVALGASKEDAVSFWFVIPPVTLSSGYSITVTDVNGNQYGKSNSNSTKVNRREVLTVGPIKPDFIQVAVDAVELDLHELSLTTGDTATLTATVTPAGASAVTWSSSNTAVATVDDSGVVTATGAGDAVITATTVYGQKTDECAVTVAPKITKKLAITPNTATIKVGQTQEFSAAFVTLADGVQTASEDATDVTWSSSNTSVASMENGTASGLTSGTVTITAKYTPAGSDVEYTGEATLEVKDDISYSLSIDPEQAEINFGETQAFTLTLITVTNGVSSSATVTGATWTSSSTAIATVSNGTATGTGTGTATITAKYTPAGSEEELSVSASLKVNEVVTYSLSIDPASATVALEKQQALTLVLTTTTNGVASNQNVTATSWTSSDDTVATVADGVVTGKKEGTVTITAKYTPAGSEELEATVEVTVIDKVPNTPGTPVVIEEGESL